jgi:hypothetical protein
MLVAGGLIGLAMVGCLAGNGGLIGGAPGTPTTGEHPDRVIINAVALGERSIVAVGGTQGEPARLAIATSADGGSTWGLDIPASSTGGSPPALVSVAFAGERIIGSVSCTATSSGGEVLSPAPADCLWASDDGGKTWGVMPAGRLAMPSFADAEHGWVTSVSNGLATGLRETDDGGATWQPTSDPCPTGQPFVAALALVSPGHGYLVCTADAAADGRQPWSIVEVRSGATSVRYQGVGTGRETVDGPADDLISAIAMRDDGGGYLGGARLYRTQDGGVSWIAVETSGVGSFDSIAVGPTETSFAVQFSLARETAVVGTEDGTTWRTLAAWPWYGSP